MSLLSLILTITVVGLVLWVINTYIPLEARIKQLLNIVVIIVLVIWLLQIFGILGVLNRPVIGVR